MHIYSINLEDQFPLDILVDLWGQGVLDWALVHLFEADV